MITLPALLAAAVGAAAQDSPAWGDLDFGPHAVGFRAFEQYDQSRSFLAKRDYFGAVVEGQRSRPMQVCVWYPARPASDAAPLTLSDYAFVPPEDMSLYRFLAGIQNREVALLHQVLGNNQNAVLEALGIAVTAVRDAEPAEGRFPLVVYHADLNGGIAENALLCEYLASHGFVVAATHSFGASSARAALDAATLETQVGDLAFVLGAACDLEFVDPDRIAAAGFRAGGLAALLLQMRNSSVDAAVLVDPTGVAGDGPAEATGAGLSAASPLYDVMRASVPMLEVSRAATPAEGTGAGQAAVPGATGRLTDPLKYARRFTLDIRAASGLDFTTYGLLRAALSPAGAAGSEGAQTAGGAASDDGRAPVAEIHAAVCGYVLNFLRGSLAGDAAGLAYLGRAPSRNGFASVTGTALDAVAEPRPPTQGEFTAMLQEGRVDVAAGLYERFKASLPPGSLFTEQAMNIQGYNLLQRGMVREAVAVFKMNADAFPGSANCFDSLGEAYVAAGENAGALECAEKVLELLPTDTSLNESLRETLRANAERCKTTLTR